MNNLLYITNFFTFHVLQVNSIYLVSSNLLFIFAAYYYLVLFTFAALYIYCFYYLMLFIFAALYIYCFLLFAAIYICCFLLFDVIYSYCFIYLLLFIICCYLYLLLFIICCYLYLLLHIFPLYGYVSKYFKVIESRPLFFMLLLLLFLNCLLLHEKLMSILTII